MAHPLVAVLGMESVALCMLDYGNTTEAYHFNSPCAVGVDDWELENSLGSTVTICRGQSPPSTMWVLALNLGSRAWRKAHLPADLSHWSMKLFVQKKMRSFLASVQLY